jgi:hypothetical protein
MHDISKAIEKQARQHHKLLVSTGAECAIDWMGTLILQALHDMHGFGRRRFAKMNDEWDKLDKNEEGFIFKWQETLENNGLNRIGMYDIADKLERAMTNKSKDMELRIKVRDMLCGILIVVLYELYRDYGFRKKRIHDIQKKIADYAWLISKKEVSIFEFMKCMNTECGIEFPVLDEYEKVNGQLLIYGE